jgi:hypothetical protein
LTIACRSLIKYTDECTLFPNGRLARDLVGTRPYAAPEGGDRNHLAGWWAPKRAAGEAGKFRTGHAELDVGSLPIDRLPSAGRSGASPSDGKTSAAGCPLTGDEADAVVGCGTLVFANACLLEAAASLCGGEDAAPTGVAGSSTSQQGPRSQGQGTAAELRAPGARAAPPDHPVGRFVLGGAAAARGPGAARGATAAPAPVLIATADDVRRFGAEGFVLVGAARLGGFTPRKPRGPSATEA